jgi:hypothetical protein
VFENEVLRRILGPMRKQVTGGSGGLHTALLSSPSAITRRMAESKRMRISGHVARMGKKRNGCILLVGKSKARDH